MPPYQAYRDEERNHKRQRTEPPRPGSPESIATPETNATDEPVQMSFYDAAIRVLSQVSPPTPKSNLKYLPLDEDTEIRLLHLTPGEPDDPIVCRLSTMSLDKPQEYRALSYCWGTDPAKHEIRIIQTQHTPGQRRSLKDIHHGTLYVRHNLYAALHHLRDLEESRVFWVDAICINQDDLRERNEQVSKMAEVYSMADHVDIWLGDGDDESDRAMEFIDLVIDPYGLDSLLNDDSTVPQWHALISLMQRPWFTRRWIIQEIMLAKKATLHCGNYVQDWSNFVAIVEMIKRHVDELKKIFAKSAKYNKDSEILSDMQTFGAYSLAHATSTLLRKSDDGRVLDRLCTLEELLLDLPAFQCGNLRDAVYAILSLAKDIPSTSQKSGSLFDHPLKPRSNSIIPISPGVLDPSPSFDVDYAKSIAEVFADVVKFYISSTGHLDILCRHWAPPKDIFPQSPSKSDPPLPSWILSVSTSTKSLGPRYRNWGLKIPNTLVGPPNRRNYNACGQYQVASPRFESSTVQKVVREQWQRLTAKNQYTKQRVSVDERRFSGFIFVQGFRLDTIAEIGPRGVEGIIPYEWLDMIDTKRDGIQEAFWRTLVANRSEDNKAAPAWYERPWSYCMNNSHYGDINMTALRQSGDAKMVKPFLERVQSVIWNRKFFVTKVGEKVSLLGLAPLEARAGDKICIFYGCSVPVILREHMDTFGHHFQFIGESYVHGMMDGEALNQQSHRDLEEATEEFKLK